MRRLLLFVCLFSCVTRLCSQQLTPTVTSPAGGFFSNQYGMLSSTVGELAAVETYGNQYLILTQGFQQPEEMITDISEPFNSDLEFDLYPNPSSGSFKILTRSSRQSSIEFKILNVLGHELLQDHFLHDGQITIHQIDITPPQGVYFISIRAIPLNTIGPYAHYLQKINIIH